jgi:predicted ABC-type transport system involved in lysophospholipase L1 biosynthesis ATPase subunit
LIVAELLSVERVCKGYSRGRQWTGALEDVSLEVGPGEIVAVLGSRLAGKTTLLKIAAGLERPDKGSVSLSGQALTDLRDRSRSRLLGREIVWLDRDGPGLKVEASKFVGWPLTLHGCGRREAERQAAQALERVGARECAGRRWGDLSNWQQMLVGLARAFAGSPGVVVIDNLLDGFRGRAAEEAQDLLRTLVEASDPPCGVLMSVSEIDAALYADHVHALTCKGTLTLMSGRLTSEGEVIPFPERAESQGHVA